MENKETITTLKGISEKESKAGRKYFSVQTDEGNMTMFDKPIIDEMMKHIGKKVRLEYAENEQGFRNVKKFLGEVSEEKVTQQSIPISVSSDKFDEQRKLKDQSIYTSYAKDVFIAMLQADKSESLDASKLMQAAIERVKQARESFRE